MLFKWFFRTEKEHKKKEIVHEMGFQEENHQLQQNLDLMLYQIKKELGNSPDLIIRTFQIGSDPQNQVAAVYLEGLTDKEKINDFVARFLLIELEDAVSPKSINSQSNFDVIKTRALTVGEVKFKVTGMA